MGAKTTGGPTPETAMLAFSLKIGGIMNWTNILLTPAITVALIAALGFLFRSWVSTRLQESISAEYKKALEVFKQEIASEEKRKWQAAELANLFSIWVKKNYDKTYDKNISRYEVQKKYWELALWLDAPILKIVNEAFTTGDGLSHKRALIAVRKIYLGKDDPIVAEDLIHWDPAKMQDGEKVQSKESFHANNNG
jgi:hypothetical protein